MAAMPRSRITSGELLQAFRVPLSRKPSSLFDFFASHQCRHRCPFRRGQFPNLNVSSSLRQFKPHVGSDPVLLRPLTLGEQRPDCILSGRESLFRCHEEVLEGLAVVLRDRSPVRIYPTKMELRLGQSLLCGLTIPLQRLAGIL